MALNGIRTSSGPCLDVRDHVRTSSRGLFDPASNPVATPATLADWADCLEPIFSLKQRRPVEAPRLHQLHPLC